MGKLVAVIVLGAVVGGCAHGASRAAPERPFGTLREQAQLEQGWLQWRMDNVLPALMRREGVDLWVLPMREYNEDPVFKALRAPTTFAARRRTIYVFFDRGGDKGVERLALGGSTQGGVFEAKRSERAAVDVGRGRQGELWGDEQWSLLKRIVEERSPRVIGIDVSRTFAFADGLSAGELEGMTEALGPALAAKFKRTEALAVDLLAVRGGPQEEETFRRMNELAWNIIRTAFSREVIEPGKTRTSDVVWWMRQRLADLGLQTWFQPSVDVQRKGFTAEQLGEAPVIERGDFLHCDFGVTAMGLNTDTQHLGYVLREGETEAPAGLRAVLATSNKLQDIVLRELRPGRTGNEVLAASRGEMARQGIDGTVYSHPVGLHGHGAGALVGLWDHQDGVPGRGDHRVVAGTWYAVELQATSSVPEWGGQKVRGALEEDAAVREGATGWFHGRQEQLHLVR